MDLHRGGGRIFYPYDVPDYAGYPYDVPDYAGSYPYDVPDYAAHGGHRYTSLYKKAGSLKEPIQSTGSMSSLQMSEMSKTYQYRKVMKPMLERKRRARINKCLDELKDLMVATLESEGEHVTRLEKADILELTVTHLQKMKQQRQHKRASGDESLTPAEGFRSGYIHAVNEVSRSLSQLPGMNVSLGTQLMTHLGQRLNQIQPAEKEVLPVTAPLSVHIANRDAYSVPISPISSYAGSPNSNTSSTSHSLLTTIDVTKMEDDSEDEENVWRPW